MPFRITRKGALQGSTVRGKTTILAPAGKSLEPAVLPIKARLSHTTTGALTGPGSQINRPLPTAVDYLVIGGGGGGAGYYDTSGGTFAGGGGGAGEVKAASSFAITQSIPLTVTIGSAGTGGTTGVGGNGTASVFSSISQPVELAVMAAAMAVHLEIVLRGVITFLVILPAMVAAEAGQLRRVKTVV